MQGWLCGKAGGTGRKGEEGLRWEMERAASHDYPKTERTLASLFARHQVLQGTAVGKDESRKKKSLARNNKQGVGLRHEEQHGWVGGQAGCEWNQPNIP